MNHEVLTLPLETRGRKGYVLSCESFLGLVSPRPSLFFCWWDPCFFNTLVRVASRSHLATFFGFLEVVIGQAVVSSILTFDGW